MIKIAALLAAVFIGFSSQLAGSLDGTRVLATRLEITQEIQQVAICYFQDLEKSNMGRILISGFTRLLEVVILKSLKLLVYTSTTKLHCAINCPPSLFSSRVSFSHSHLSVVRRPSVRRRHHRHVS